MVEDFNKSVEELKQEDGFKVRLAIAKAIDRENLIERALFGRGAPGYGTINPAMRYFFDTAINETSEQAFDLEAAQALLADAGFPGGEGFPTLKLLVTPAGKREGEILVDMLKKNLGIDVELDIKDFPVLIDHFDAMDYDMVRIGSPAATTIPTMDSSTGCSPESKFNGPNRDESMAFGYFSESGSRLALVEQERVETDLEKRVKRWCSRPTS
jgi:peptide/nickel transport system substrate-binding protein